MAEITGPAPGQSNSNNEFPIPKRNIFGVDLAVITRIRALNVIHHHIASKRLLHVVFCNAHTANIAVGDSSFLRALDGPLVLPDGVGIDIASTVLYGAPFPENLNGTDFAPAILLTSDRPLDVGLIGAKPGTVDKAAAALRLQDSRHTVRVLGHGYLSKVEERLILNEIRKTPLDVIFVAKGNPQQEFWIKENADLSVCTVAVGVGALFDFLAGNVPRAPTLIRKLRFEWAFRLIQEPRRLAQRYLMGNGLFLWRVLRVKLASYLT